MSEATVSSEGNRHKPVGPDEKNHRGGRLGQRSPGQVVETKLRIVGSDAKTAVLDVAAFNSFVG